MAKTPISKEGFEALKAELDQLLEVERPRVVDEVAFAAAQGDRSENAEYIYGKRRLREIDRRVRFLSKRIDGAQVVEGPPPDQGEVRFGATVDLVGVPGRAMRISLVGEDEIEPAAGRISVKSPVGKALLGKRLGEEIEVSTPKGSVAWTIGAIAYP